MQDSLLSRYLPWLAFALLFPLLVSLGVWQLSRAAEKKQMLLDREARATQAPIALNRALTLQQEDRYRPATATGTYDTTRQWLLDNRIRQGQPGYHVYSLLRLPGRDTHLLVNRGWVRLGSTRDLLPELPLPAGQVKLAGRLDRPATLGMVMGETHLASPASKVVVPTFTVAQMSEAIGVKLLPWVLTLDAGQPSALAYDWVAKESISPDKHVGYAVQWFALAAALVIIVVGVLWRRRREQESQA